jgi:uncharacterized repeat protein (TIGR01451 family)
MYLQREIRSASVHSESGSAIRSILISFAITLVALFGFAEAGMAQVVNTTADYAFDEDQEVTSLREILQSPFFFCDGPCTITFNIPIEDPGYDEATGTFTIRLDPLLGPLPPLEQFGLHIDGTSQAIFLDLDSNPAGPEIVIDGSQLAAPAHGFEIINASNTIINHLVIHGFPGHGIVVRGLDFFPSDNSIIGNYIGTNVRGTGAVPNTGNGIHLEGNVVNTVVRNNLIGGNGGWGVFADVFYGDNNNNRIRDNKIGAGFGGENLGNGLGGVHLDSFADAVGFPQLFLIDGATDPSLNSGTRSRPVGRGEAQQPSVGVQEHAPLPGGNVIAFNGGPGIMLDAGATGNLIYGNRIYSNAGEGVLLTASASTGNNITLNDIFSNGALGIDLGGDGVTLNDGTSNDGAGPNEYVDFPVITSAYFDGTNTVIEGTYQDPNYSGTQVNIEVFSNAVADPSGYGEGESWLDNTSTVLTGGVDPWTLSVTGDLSGQFVTATGALFSSTSEFSQAFQVQVLDLGIEKTGPATVVAGQPLVYTLTVTNYGPVTGGAVTVSDPLPAGVAFTSVTFTSSTGNAGWVCGETGGTVECVTQAMDELEVLTVTINALAPSTGGDITNTATVAVAPQGTDLDPLNNSSSVITNVETANLTVSKTASPEPVEASAPLTYTITVGNTGPAAADGVSLTDDLPAGVTYQGFSGTGWTCSGTTTISCTFASPLASGASTVLTLNVLAPPTGGTITNNVSVSTTTPESSLADNTASAQTTVNPPPADLSIFKDGPASVEPGDSITWTITVTNLGPGTAFAVSVTDTLPSSVTFGSVVAPAGWSCSHSAGVVNCSVASMADSESAVISIDATAPPSEGTITNVVSVSSQSVDPSSTNDSSSTSTTISFTCPQGVPEPIAPAFGTTEPDTEVTFSWRAVADAVGYQVVLLPENAPAEVIGSVAGSAPAGQTMSLVGTARPGLNVWAVRALFNSCPTAESTRFTFTVRSCPTGVPILLNPLGGTVSDSPVVFRWTGVSGAIRYDLHASINSSPFGIVESVDSTGSAGEFTTTLALNPGSTVTWFVEAHFPDNCPPTRSEVAGFEAGCFPPIPSVVGEVTSGKPYEVRATIGTAADQYEFQESLDPFFTTIVDTKLVTSVPGSEYVAALFEHEVETPIRYHYRARILNANNCPFSPPTSTAVIPIPDPASLDTDVVVQFGIEEPVTQQILIPSPDPASGLSFTFLAETDREWLTVSPSAGTMGPEGALFTVVANPEGLPVGTNTGTVIVTFTAIASGKVAQNSVGTTTSVPVSVSLVTPVTNRGKDSPVAQSLIIPAVAHVDGVGAKWRTDARLVNLGLTPERYFLNFTSSQEDGTRTGKSAEIRLAPGQTTALDDMVKHWYGLGSIAGEGATGVLEIRPLTPTAKTGSALVTRSLNSVASSRTYAKSGLATMGQFIPALPFSVFVGSRQPEQPQTVLSLQQLAQTSDFRTNLGLVEASGNPASVEIRFFDAAGASLVNIPVSLQAGEHRQFNQILAQNGFTNVPVGRAEVEVMSGEGRITAYASVVDNATSDPLLVEGVNLANLGASKYVVPGIAHLETGAARWRSDMQIFNAGSASVRATLQFFRTGESTAAATQQVELQPGTITSLQNVVAMFGQSNVGGAVQVTTDSTSQLVVTARTFDQQENGTVGQFIPAVTVEDAIGIGDRAIQVLQMEESPNIRSNLGVVEVMGQAVTLEISAFAAESRTTPRVQVQLRPNEFRQFNQILRSLNVGNTYNARIAVRVVGGDGRIAAYGSAVDNRTQDPTYVPGQ